VKIDPELNLPVKYTDWREDQYQAVKAVTTSNRPFFLLDAPTGIGKSLIGIGSHRILGGDCVYITRTKQLQDQIMRDFGDIAVTLKGRANYPCLLHYDQFPNITADDCHERKSCREARECPYRVAKQRAKDSPLAVLNDAYFLNEVNGFNSSFAGRQLMVVDEVDSIENGLMNYIQFTITNAQADRYGLTLPNEPEKKESWSAWIPGTVKQLNGYVEGLAEGLRDTPDELWTMTEIDLQRQLRRLEKMSNHLAFLGSEVDWTWIFYTRDLKPGTEYIFKPVSVGKYADRFLWNHGSYTLGMSGTIFSADITCRDLGIGDCDYMRLDCPFPVENRPIYYKPVCNLTRKTMQVELPILRDEIEETIEKYPEGKVLIHTVSYPVRNYLLENLSCRERLMTHESHTRERALAEFKDSKEPWIMLSPSFDRGVDLPAGDNCQAVIVCKIPYLDMSDPQVKRKLEMPGGQTWYFLKATQTLVQMTGRSVRSDKQKCDTWIFDKQFSRLRHEMRSIIPSWWLRAVQDVPVKSNQSRLPI
jgi:Rad3-related DNA helicase